MSASADALGDQDSLRLPRALLGRDGLSGAVAADEGLIRTTADNSPPSGTPGILVGFIEEAEAVAAANVEAEERRAAVIAELTRLFGDPARKPELYREKSWGEDAYCRGADGGYWSPRVWTTYGHAIREPHGLVHWGGPRPPRFGTARWWARSLRVSASRPTFSTAPVSLSRE